MTDEDQKGVPQLRGQGLQLLGRIHVVAAEVVGYEEVNGLDARPRAHLMQLLPGRLSMSIHFFPAQ